jgi:hypothetical protein
MGWSIGVGLAYYALRRYRRGAWIIAAGVLSHWALDFVVHRPDMPLAPGVNIFVGLGLWSSVTATVIVEGLLFAVGLLIYVRFTEPVDRTGRHSGRSSSLHYFSMSGLLFSDNLPAWRQPR